MRGHSQIPGKGFLPLSMTHFPQSVRSPFPTISSLYLILPLQIILNINYKRSPVARAPIQINHLSSGQAEKPELGPYMF